MTHLRSRGLTPETETELSPPKAAWRADRFVAPKDILKLFARIEFKRIPGDAGDRLKRVRSDTHPAGKSDSRKDT